MMDTWLDFRILGPLEVYAGGAPVGIAGSRQRTVLAMLLTAADRVVSVATLADAVWDGRPPATGRTQVAICVAGLRKSFRAAGCQQDVVTTTAPGYQLVLGGHRLDAHDFLALVARAREAARQGRTRQAAALFGEALAHWRGPALADNCSTLVRSAGASWDEERLCAFEQYMELRLELGEHQQVLGELTEAVRQEPLREQTRAHLMLAYYRCGRRAEALEVFRDGRRRTIAELGLEPGPVLQEMHGEVLRDGTRLLAGTGRGGPIHAGTAAAAGASTPERGLAELDHLLVDRLERSYQALTPDLATMYRRLTLASRAGAGAAAGAALLAICPDEAAPLLEQLVAAQLVDLVGRDLDGRPRVRLAGLRRIYAQSRAQAEEPAPALRAATTRLAAAGLLPDAASAAVEAMSRLPEHPLTRLPVAMGRLLTGR